MSSHNRQLSINRGQKLFACRICRRTHPLRICRKFLNMNTTERKEVVKKYGYCSNCLAHSHSQGSCFTKTGCKYCQKKHHSLLHMHPRLSPTSSRVPSSRYSSKRTSSRSAKWPNSAQQHLHAPLPETATTNITSLAALFKQNTVTLLPTAIVKIEANGTVQSARCLVDSGTKTSCISKRFVEKHNLTTLELDEDVMCPITLHSYTDSKFKLNTVLKVNNRISVRTPAETLPESVRCHFQHYVLADTHFYKSSSIDIILGANLYSHVICDGTSIRVGLPSTQNTVFGVVICGNLPVN